jgi:YbbR domain-containing protein
LANISISSWGIRAGALILSFALWLHAVTEKYYDKEIAVRLWIEVPPPGEGVDGDMVLASEVPSTVRVLVTGGGKDLLFDLDDDSFVLRLRAEGKSRIHRLTPSQITKRVADLDVEVKEILEPKEIAIALAPRMERDVPVRVQASIEVAAAHVQVTLERADPALVRVIGPQQQVAALRYVETDSLVLRDVREDVDVEWSLRHPGQTQLAFVPEAVRVRATVQMLAEDDLIGVPITVRHAGEARLRPEPATAQVKVRGGVSVIAQLDPARDIELYVDYAEYQGSALPVRSPEMPIFEVRQIAPAYVDLVSY